MVKVGVIGCGFMGSMHLNCYNSIGNAKVVAVADVRADKLSAATLLTGAKGYKTGHELILNADVTAIDICLPTYLHAEYAIAAMRNGKDVFIEKPVCMSEAEGIELVKVARETGKKVQIGQVIRFWDEYVFLKKLIDSQEFGHVRHANLARISSKPTWGWDGWLDDLSRSGGAALDLHIHDADYLLYAFGQPLSTHAVMTTGKCANGYIASINQYKDFCVSIEGGWDFPATTPFEMSYRVAFDKATIAFSSIKGIMVYPNEGEAYEPKIERTKTVASASAGGNISSLGGYYNELVYFINCLDTNTIPTMATLEDSIKSVKFVLDEVKNANKN